MSNNRQNKYLSWNLKAAMAIILLVGRSRPGGQNQLRSHSKLVTEAGVGPTPDPRPSALSSADAAAGIQQHLGLVQAPPCLQCSLPFCQAVVPKGRHWALPAHFYWWQGGEGVREGGE